MRGDSSAYTSPMCQSYRGKGRHFFPIHYPQYNYRTKSSPLAPRNLPYPNSGLRRPHGSPKDMLSLLGLSHHNESSYIRAVKQLTV